MRKFFVAAVVAAASLFASAGSAEAAFRIRVSATGDGGVPVYIYSNSSNSGGAIGFIAGNFTANIQTASSNFSGSSLIGSLSQTLTIGNSGAGGNIDVLVEIVQAVAGISDGVVTNAGQIASLQVASVLTWSLPVGNPLIATSDVSASTNALVAGTATAFNTTTVNATSFNSLTMHLNPAEGERMTTLAFNGSTPYTLSSHLFVQNMNAGVPSTPITGSSSVVATPAPAGLVLVATATPALAFGWFRRRKAQAASV